jgi:large subunit ribosomal protein L1
MTTTISTNKNRSKTYRANVEKISQATKGADVTELAEAIATLKDLEQPKFKNGPSVELHVRLSINPTKSDQFVRSNVVLPHGTGKKVRIAAFVTADNIEVAKKAGAEIAGSDELIEEIKKTGKVDFDIAIAQPEMMRKLPVIARILGTAGVMPNPKTGTVGDNIEEMLELILKGKVDYKNDKTGNIHIMVGRFNKSFTTEQIVQNIEAAMDSLEKAKPESIKKKFIISAYVTCTQSPSIRFR